RQDQGRQDGRGPQQRDAAALRHSRDSHVAGVQRRSGAGTDRRLRRQRDDRKGLGKTHRIIFFTTDDTETQREPSHRFTRIFTEEAVKFTSVKIGVVCGFLFFLRVSVSSVVEKHV